MKPLKLIITTLIVILVSQHFYYLIAQETQNKLSLEKGTIANRFDYVIKESTVFEDSRVVKSWWLTRLKTHVMDTLKDFHLQINTTQKLILTRNNQIDSLNIALKEVKNDLLNLEKEKNSIRLVGIQLSKNSYKTIMWAIVLILGILLISFVVLFQRSNLVTRQVKISMEELRLEFEAHKKSAREREEKLSVAHLREINKLRGNKI